MNVGSCTYMIVPAIARPSVPPRFRTKLMMYQNLYGNEMEDNLLAEGGDNRHILSLDASLDGDQGWLQCVPNTYAG